MSLAPDRQPRSTPESTHRPASSDPVPSDPVPSDPVSSDPVPFDPVLSDLVPPAPLTQPSTELSPDLVPPPPAPPRPSRPVVPRTRTSAVWFGIWAGALVLVLLIIFIAQNTANVEITFLWMHGSLPLALALLVAGVGVAVVAMGIAAARIAQLRRLIKRRN
jgi:putative membrane protein